MKFLFLLRHAKSSWDDPLLNDHDRPLNPRGLKTAPLMGRLAVEKGFRFDAVLSSPAKRARKTAEIFTREAKYLGRIDLTPTFYPGEPEDYIHILSQQDDESANILVVGHNPGMEELLELLTGTKESMPTATLAQIRLPIKYWKELTSHTKGNLLHLLKPKEIFKELDQ